MKFLVLGVILYGYYRFFYKNPSLNAAKEDPIIQQNDNDDDYTDYEEVE